MFARAILPSLLLTFAHGVSFAQEAPRKLPPPDNETEVLFANGSLVRMQLLQEAIEVETRYGKLTIPCKEIRRVDFGVHLPEGAEQQIDAAIKKLASPHFKHR